MSDYDIQPKPKVWAGSPTSAKCSAELRPNVVCWDLTTSFTGECTDWLENVVVNKQVPYVHASCEMAYYLEKLQRIVYEQK